MDKTSNVKKASAKLSNSLLSSPPRASSSQSKERRNPSITPRKFKRFFTPRIRVSSQPTAARRALRDVTRLALNSGRTSSRGLQLGFAEPSRLNEQPNAATAREVKRRKLHHYTPESSPVRQTTSVDVSQPNLELPTTHPGLLSPLQSSQEQDFVDSDGLESEDEWPGLSQPLRQPVPLTRRGMSAQLVQRMTGDVPSRGGHVMSRPVGDWRMETADFCSTPEEVHMCSSHEGAARCIPFSVTGCHKNSLVAIGDEEGHIRLLDSEQSFDKIHLSFPAHSNAIIDLAFSEDDHLLATASGDQTGKVIDMMTQTPISVLGHHSASLKQIRFQPGRGAGSVLATSSRDGSIQIWDLRCRGGPVQQIPGAERDSSLGYRAPRMINQGCVVNSISDAHARQLQPYGTAIGKRNYSSIDVASRSEVPGRFGEVSVTAIEFLPPGREHLLLSACEADACVRLWDIRAIHSSSSRHANRQPLPVSWTPEPEDHTLYRAFGIAAMALSTDGARLYTLCKDNTAYAYSTAHLILGHAPNPADPPRRFEGAHTGRGPLYGFRHPQLHATSFYVKAEVRPARDGRPELLAVGSSDGCAVLFPTDERYFRRDLGAEPRFGLRASQWAGESMPIVDGVGTPLVRGHDKEVGALAWTAGGGLVTLGDDYLARCWHEDREKATDLRRGGESGGRRWASGWADVGEMWDGDEDDW